MQVLRGIIVNSIETLTTFFGWCTVINVVALAITSIMLMLMRNFISGIHGKMFGVNKEDLPLTYVQYLGNYKIAIIVLNIVPYIVLRIMMQ